MLNYVSARSATRFVQRAGASLRLQGNHYVKNTVCLSVCLSVRSSVTRHTRFVIMLSLIIGPLSENHFVYCEVLCQTRTVRVQCTETVKAHAATAVLRALANLFCMDRPASGRMINQGMGLNKSAASIDQIK